ncbi:MAG: uroporphyrinogen-III synthase [Bacillaceae bacterium]|nr:uroporphyrinogen-III synthase [Bacillaceae bacterium]
MKLPLDGKRILITRAPHQADELAALIRQKGGEPVSVPLIKTISPADPDTQKALTTTLSLLDQFDWIIFTSTNAVNFFFEHLGKRGKTPADISHLRTAVVGPKTAQLLREKGLSVDVMPEQYDAEGLLQALEQTLKPGARVLFPRAKQVRRLLPESLKEKGVDLTEVVIYETVPAMEYRETLHRLIRNREVDAITFTSSSTVKHFVSFLEGYNRETYLKGIRLVSIGPVTAKTAEKLGVKIDAFARTYTMQGLVEALCQLYKS